MLKRKAYEFIVQVTKFQLPTVHRFTFSTAEDGCVGGFRPGPGAY